MGNYSEGSFTVDGTTYPEPNNYTRRGVKFERWYQCSTCCLDFRKSEVGFYNGKPYGIRCGDYKAIVLDNINNKD